jgi:hypothetical protein
MDENTPEYFLEYFYSRFIAILKSLGFLAMSAPPPEEEIVRPLRHVRKVPQADISSILMVRTLGRCKPVAQSLTEAAVPDAS